MRSYKLQPKGKESTLLKQNNDVSVKEFLTALVTDHVQSIVEELLEREIVKPDDIFEAKKLLRGQFYAAVFYIMDKLQQTNDYEVKLWKRN